MANYKETSINGTEYQRCYLLKIYNPIDGYKKAVFDENKVITIGDKKVITESYSCEKLFNPTSNISILDPVTGNPTGEQVTHQKLYEILYSLYIQTALERDANNP